MIGYREYSPWRKSVAIVTFLAIAVSLFFTGCSENTAETRNSAGENDADRIMHDASIDFTSEGKPSGKLRAKKLLFFDDEHRVFGYDVEVDFFDKDGEHAARLVADSGWVDNRTRNVTVYGEVYLVTEEDTELWADSLSYYAEIEKIMTDSPVEIRRGDEYLSGVGLISDQEFENIRIKGDVSGRFQES